MVSSSLFGFRDALTFQHVDENIINQVEEFIANDISQMIDKWISKDVDLQIYKKAFFGILHEDEPKSFKFSVGDRIQLRELGNYIRSVIENENLGIAHFAQTSENKIRKINNQIEQYFGFSRKIVDVFPSYSTSIAKESLSDDKLTLELKERLFANVKKMLDKKGVSRSKIEKLLGESVSVNIRGNRITGKFTCVLCRGSRPFFTAQCSQKSGKYYWILSNYGTHIQKHLNESKSIQSNCLIEHIEEEVEVELVDEDFKSGDEDIQSEKLNENDENELVEDATDTKHEVTPEQLELADFVSEIYKQISSQMTRMNTIILKNDEHEFDMNYTLQNKQHTLKIAQVSANGGCLYGALGHQLYGQKIDSEEHEISAKQLRIDVVGHINRNFDSFEHALKGSVYDISDRNKSKRPRNIKKACKDFLNKKLPIETTWGGFESIAATNEMKGVNILIINENGTCYFSPSGFDQRLTQTVVLAFRVGAQSEENASQTIRQFKMFTATTTTVSYRSIKMIFFRWLICLRRLNAKNRVKHESIEFLI